MDVEEMTKLKAQSSRQTPNPKHQNPGVRGSAVGSLRFGPWRFPGALGLELGALAVAAMSLAGCLIDKPAPASTDVLSYPATRKTNTVDDYHGVKVADPYRWLEDDNAPETRAWVEAQNGLTFGYLQQIPELPVIQARLTRLWNYE